jgi:hypothetical protein
MAAKKPERVRHGHVSLPLWLHAKGWRWAWRDTATGRWKYGTRRDRKDALAAAHRQAVALATATTTLHDAIADPAIESVLSRAVSLGLTHADLDRLEQHRTRQSVSLGDLVAAFLAAKEAARGPSRRNIRSLTSHLDGLLGHFGHAATLDTITTAHIEKWMADGEVSARTRHNRRAVAVTLWRWARTRKMIPDEITAPESAERPILVRGIPSTWSPDELRKLWAGCPVSHRPWLALTAWAGLRGEETYQEDPLSGKDVITWGDIDLKRARIDVRPLVAKLGVRRIIPIQPCLLEFLQAERKRRHDEPATTPVCPGRPPSRDLPVINRAVTTILGEAVGGWRPNALRHSFISYRAAQVGLARAAMEAGNSESEARKSYHDAMTEEDAAAWFSRPFGTSSEPHATTNHKKTRKGLK